MTTREVVVVVVHKDGIGAQQTARTLRVSREGITGELCIRSVRRDGGRIQGRTFVFPEDCAAAIALVSILKRRFEGSIACKTDEIRQRGLRMLWKCGNRIQTFSFHTRTLRLSPSG